MRIPFYFFILNYLFCFSLHIGFATSIDSFSSTNRHPETFFRSHYNNKNKNLQTGLAQPPPATMTGVQQRKKGAAIETRGGQQQQQQQQQTTSTDSSNTSRTENMSVMSKLRQTVFPIYGQEVTKFFLLAAIKFFIILALTITRDTKDVMIVTQCGAEAIAFLKVSLRKFIIFSVSVSLCFLALSKISSLLACLLYLFLSFF